MRQISLLGDIHRRVMPVVRGGSFLEKEAMMWQCHRWAAGPEEYEPQTRALGRVGQSVSDQRRHQVLRGRGRSQCPALQTRNGISGGL